MIKSSWHQMEIRSSSSLFFSREHFSPLFREIFEQAPAHCNRSHREIRLNQRALYSQGTTAPLGEEREDFNPNSKYQNPGRGGLPSIKERKNKSRICVNKSGGACPGQVNNRLHLLPRAPLHFCTLVYLVLGCVNQFSSVTV